MKAMPWTLAILLVLPAALASPPGTPDTETPTPPSPAKSAGRIRPNILYIVADDLGWKDVGFHGSDIRTPNLNKLAEGGARLEGFYSQPMCTPARACLLTGRYPFRYGLQTFVIPPGRSFGLPTNEWLLPQSLKQAGYATAIVGLWRLGHSDHNFWPLQRGFDFQYGPLAGEIDYFTHQQHHLVDWYSHDKLLREPGYSTLLIGNEAVKVVDAHDTSAPLFLYLAFNAPHTPYQAPQDYLDLYSNISDSNRQTYAAMITAMDGQIGRVIDALEKKHMRTNTLILFQSDSGGTRSPAAGSAATKANTTVSPCDNGPFRGGKGSLYEGGSRVVAIANWPGHIKTGSIVDGMLHVADMFPTLAGLAGVPIPTNRPMDGFDIWPTLSQGQPSPRTEIVYTIEPFRAAIREDDWKLLWRTPLPSAVELYNLARDPSETNNLAAANPERVAALQRRVNELAATMEKPLLLEMEFEAMRAHLGLPPASPGEMFQLDQEPEAKPDN